MITPTEGGPLDQLQQAVQAFSNAVATTPTTSASS